MNTDKITREEMRELFGEDCPVEAVQLMFEATPDTTVAELRAQLRELAAARQR